MKGKDLMTWCNFLTPEAPEEQSQLGCSMIEALEFKANHLIHKSVMFMMTCGLDQMDAWNAAMPFHLIPLCKTVYDILSAKAMNEFAKSSNSPYMAKMARIHELYLVINDPYLSNKMNVD